MPPYLQVRFIIQGTEEVRYGTVAAWSTVESEGTPGHGFHALTGYADPILAAQLLEEAIRNEGDYVWIIPDQDNTGDGLPGEVKLDGLLLIYGADIHSGRVRTDGPTVGPVDSGEPAPAPAVDPVGNVNRLGATSPATDSGGAAPAGGGLIEAAAD